MNWAANREQPNNIEKHKNSNLNARAIWISRVTIDQNWIAFVTTHAIDIAEYIGMNWRAASSPFFQMENDEHFDTVCSGACPLPSP